MRSVVSIVEGHGEEDSVPILLRRLLNVTDFIIEHPIRVKRDQFLKMDASFIKTVDLASKKAGINGIILVLMDADDDCPATVGPSLFAAVRAKILPQQSLICVMAMREFEAWFLSAAESLRGKRGLPFDLEPPGSPESIRGAKEWLSEKMLKKYRPVMDQPALTSIFDISTADARSSSFNKLIRDVRAIEAQGDEG
jgi:hypothetical protein